MMTRTRPTRSGSSRSDEKAEQAGTVKLLQLLGADVYTIGTRRPRGHACPSCGTFVPEHAGTCQTPGLPDLLAFLPGDLPRPVCFIEQKREGGRLSPEQQQFRVLAEKSSALYVPGTMTDVLAWLTDRGYLRGRSLMHELAALTGKAAPDGTD